MSKRAYTHIEQFEPLILSMREAGMTRQEIADELGLTKIQIKKWITRYNHRQSNLRLGITAKRKGRPRKRPLSSTEEYEREISRLQMENRLLRDFLQSVERM
jgi:predicted transcriptional regulator